MKQRIFEQLHPVSVCFYFACALICCFVCKSEALAIIFILQLIFAMLQKKAKIVLWSLPLAGFMLLLNPIFYHGGTHVFYTWRGYNFTLEAIENGVYCALLILCTMLIFTVLGTILSEEKFLYIFGRAFPSTALMIAMIFKHFDILSESYRQTKNMAQMNGIYDNDKTLWQKLKTNAVIFEAFTGAALEGSLDTALSLTAKGYYSKHKTHIKRYHFRAADAALIAVTAAFFALTFFDKYYHLIGVALLFLLPLFLCMRRETK